MSGGILAPVAWERWGWMADAVAGRHGVPVSIILGPCRGEEIVAARRDLASCLYGSGLSYSRVARLLGRHHTTIMDLVRQELRR